MATVTLFLATGETFTFRKAKVVADTERELLVSYVSASDGEKAGLRVRKPAIVAYSVKE